MACALPPAWKHLAAVYVHRPAVFPRWLAGLTGHPGIQQCGSPGEVYISGAGNCSCAFAYYYDDSHRVPPLSLLSHFTKFQVPTSVEDDHNLDQEIHNTVRKIIRDVVSSWYSTVSSESVFETEVQEAMISMGMELKLRAKQVDRKVL